MRSFIALSLLYNRREYRRTGRLELDLVDGLVEGLALDRGDLELECGRLARAIGGGEGTSSPRRSTVRLGEVGDLAEGLCVAEGNEDYRCIMRSGYWSANRENLLKPW